MAESGPWFTKPNTPARMAELVARSVPGAAVGVGVLLAVVVVTGATAEWLAGIGAVAVVLWFAGRLLPATR